MILRLFNKPFNKIQKAALANKGQAAEDWACEYLIHQGLEFIERNFHSRHGEIDLIMEHQGTLVFIEVRYRKNLDFGGALESITPKKQNRIRKTALYYMQTRQREFNARLDVFAMNGEGENYQFEWIQNAF